MTHGELAAIDVHGKSHGLGLVIAANELLEYGLDTQFIARTETVATVDDAVLENQDGVELTIAQQTGFERLVLIVVHWRNCRTAWVDGVRRLIGRSNGCLRRIANDEGGRFFHKRFR